MSPNKKAFTLIELLVVIAIIGILATISVLALSNARAKSRDAKRAGDMKQIQTALELFFNDKNRYPTAEEWAAGKIYSTSTGATSTYMQVIPSAPTPADGNCNSNQNSISYSPNSDNSSYSISFCLGNTTGTLTPGPKCLTPGGIVDRACFVCGDNIVDSRDSRVYPTVKIGDQCWMAQNLNVGDYVGNGASVNGFNGIFGDNDDCADVYPSNGWWSCQGSSGIQKYCYDNNQSNCFIDGGLYEWAESLGLPSDCNYATSTDAGNGSYSISCPISGVKTILAKQQGICLPGWHIPSDSDWQILERGLATNYNCDSSSDYCLPAGDKLKAINDCSTPGSPDCGSSGFNGLLVGYRNNDGSFGNRSTFSIFWSASPFLGAPGRSWDRYFSASNSEVRRNFNRQSYGFSVRCLQD